MGSSTHGAPHPLLNRRLHRPRRTESQTAYATLAAALAAEAADLDIVWGFRGPVEELKHHRGITHTFIAVPVVAAVTVGAAWLFHRWNENRRRRKLEARPSIPGEPIPVALQPVVVRWGWLYLTAFMAALSHIAARLDQQLRRTALLSLQSAVVRR